MGRRAVSALALACAVLFVSSSVAVAHGTPRAIRACESARAQSPVPLAPGWTERCSSPYWHWGVSDFGAHLISYNPAKVGTSAVRWRHTVAHERCHSHQTQISERGADACARSYGVDTSPSPYG